MAAANDRSMHELNRGGLFYYKYAKTGWVADKKAVSGGSTSTFHVPYPWAMGNLPLGFVLSFVCVFSETRVFLVCEACGSVIGRVQFQNDFQWHDDMPSR